VSQAERPNTAAPVAEHLRGFGPVGLLGLLIILAGNFLVAPLSAVLVLVWAHLSQTPWQSLGFTAPRSWTRVVAIGIPLGMVFKLAMKALVMPLFGAPAVNPHYHFLTGNAEASLWMLFTVVVVGGFGEETVFRGFLFERLGKLLGTRPAALTATVLLTSTLFALLHYREQGLPGVEQAAVTGLVFGTTFAATGQLWLPMVIHAAFDVTAVALIYWNWESAVAHFLFR
jgi:membrane protease YdiL (CAAX protease family)